MLGFNVDNYFGSRTAVKTLAFITCYHTTMTLFIFENLFCLPTKDYFKCSFLFETSFFT